MPGELPAFLVTPFNEKWTEWASLRGSGEASRRHDIVHSVFSKYQALFLSGEDTAMNKMGEKSLPSWAL